MIHTVGIAEIKMSSSPEDVVVTHALGSCLGITVYDPMVKVGGMLHAMLPLSEIEPAKAAANPAIFVDTGVNKLLESFYKSGGQKSRLIMVAAGGASSKADEKDDYFQIGKRNFVMLRRLLWSQGIVLKSSEVGGHIPRGLTLRLNDGRVTIKNTGNETVLLAPQRI